MKTAENQEKRFLFWKNPVHVTKQEAFKAAATGIAGPVLWRIGTPWSAVLLITDGIIALGGALDVTFRVAKEKAQKINR